MATADGGTPKGEANAPSKEDSGGATSKRIRPCQRCQKLKVRCERSTDGGPCQRCQAKKRECTFEEVPSKKRKKNPDERIDELEKTLAAMRDSLAAANHHANGPHMGEQAGKFGASHGQPLDILARTAVSAHAPTLDRVTSGNTFPATSGTEPHTPNPHPRASTSESSSASSPNGNTFDPIERRWVDYEDAKSLFERFITIMLPCFPVFSFGPELPDFELIRRHEPVLFLSILAAAAGNMTSDDTYGKLQTEAISVITYQSIVKGQKRSELLLSLLVITCWPMAPTRFDQLSAYLQMHIVSGMAIDLGLQRSNKEMSRNLSTKLLTEEVEPGNRKENFARPLERERTWLVTYLLAVGFAIGMRRPQTLDWSVHHETCSQALLNSGDRNDLKIVRIVQLWQISQDISKTFAYDSQPKSKHTQSRSWLISELSDPTIYLTLKGFRTQIDRWREENQDIDVFENFWYHATVVHLNELSLHSFHDPGDLRPPFGLNVRVDLPIAANPVVSAAHLDCISRVVHSAQKMLDIIFSLHFREDEVSLISNLPIVFFARALYAWVTLVRVASIGNAVYDESALRVTEYLERLMQVLDEAATVQHFHTAMKFSWILRILRHTFKHKKGLPQIPQPDTFNVATYQSIRAADKTGSLIPTTLRPLEPEFPTEMDFTPQLSSSSGAMPIGDNFDWDAAMQNIGNWFNTIGAGVNNTFFDEQPFNFL